MTRYIFKRLAWLIGGGVLTAAFMAVAQVNLDDFRLKAGQLRPVPDPIIQVGGFYSILPDGRIEGPHCVYHEDVVRDYLRQYETTVLLANKLGMSVPVLTKWAGLFGEFLGTENLQDLQESTNSAIAWAGYSLKVEPARHISLISTSVVRPMVDRIYKLDPWCEVVVKQLAEQGDCVQVIFRIVEVGSQKVGYKLPDDRCLIPNTMDQPIFAPHEPGRLMANLSAAKEWMGLLDSAVAQEF